MGSYRVYFEAMNWGGGAPHILAQYLEGFLLRNAQMTKDEDDALAENPDFWRMIEEAATASRDEA